MKKTLIATVSAMIFAALVCPAQALNTRTWISGKGVDQAGCGPVVSPCRTLQYAHDNTSAGGEIDVLDPAGYGSVKINRAISIINDGVGTAGVLPASGQNGIEINTTGAVVLRGLTIEGAGIGRNGIDFLGGDSLTITNCIVQNFVGNDNYSGNGILLVPISGTPIITITNTMVSDNQYIGLSYLPTISGSAFLTLDHVTATRNKVVGIAIYTFNSSGAPAVGSISNSLASNSVTGIQVDGGTFMLDNVQAFQNNVGVYVNGTNAQPAFVSIARSTAANNVASNVGNDVKQEGVGALISYGDNHFQFTAYVANKVLKTLY